MKLSLPKIVGVGVIIAFALSMGVPATSAEEAPKVSRKVLLKQEMTLPEREAVMIAVELPPGSEEGKHTHPAELYAVVLEGSLLLEVDGKANATYKAGEAFSVAPGVAHNGKNTTAAPVKLTAFLVAEKGKPLSAPAK